MKTTSLLPLACVLFFLAACGPSTMQMHEAWTRPTASGGNAAVYFLLDNATGQDDALISVSTNIARVVEIHHSRLVEASDMHQHSGEAGSQPISELEAQDMADVMIMEPESRLEIAAGREIVFEPGSYHLMLIDVKQDLEVGDSFIITLHFEHAEDLEVMVTALAP